MTEVTITQILDDLRAADEITRRFERRYWLDSADFYDLYMQGRLDDGEHTEDFAMWAGFYEVKRDREVALKQLSRERVRQLSISARDTITIDPREPTLRPTVA
jgi:glycogen debranching enzyme